MTPKSDGALGSFICSETFQQYLGNFSTKSFIFWQRWGGGGGVGEEQLFFSWLMWDNCAYFNCDQLAIADKETKINVVFVKYI